VKTRHAREIRWAITDAKAGRWPGMNTKQLIPATASVLYWEAWNRTTRARNAKDRQDAPAGRDATKARQATDAPTWDCPAVDAYRSVVPAAETQHLVTSQHTWPRHTAPMSDQPAQTIMATCHHCGTHIDVRNVWDTTEIDRHLTACRRAPKPAQNEHLTQAPSTWGCFQCGETFTAHPAKHARHAGYAWTCGQCPMVIPLDNNNSHLITQHTTQAHPPTP
jgi:hypothetical protein